jgi:hypothetical protein
MRTAVRAHLAGLGVLAAFAVLPVAFAQEEKGKKQKEIDPQPGKTVTIKGRLTDKDGTDTKREGCYAKVFPIKLAKDGRYTIIMRSNDVDSYLRLEAPGGNQVAEDDDSGKGDTGLDAQIEYTGEKDGTYKLICTTFAAGTTGDFVLTVQREGGGGGKGSADFKSIRGQLTAKDNFDKVRQQMYCKIYPVKLLAGQNYQIDMKSSDFDSYLRLEDPDGNQIAEDDDGGGFPNARIKQDINKTGVYKIIATSFGANSTGNFVVEIRGKGVGEGSTSGGGGGEDSAGGSRTIKGQLADSDPEYKNRKGSFHKAYTQKFEKGKTYTIDMVSSDVDSYLFLENPSGKVVAQDDDGGGFPNARINYKAAEAGDYKIIATTFKAGETGAFTITVKGVGGAGGGDEKPAKAGEAKALKEGALTKDRITDKDKGYANRNNHYHKPYTVKMQEGKTYVITMRSDDFDSYLFLEDGKGKVLAEDDDSGGGNTGLDAQIVFNCTKAGDYRIIATTYAQNATGNYTIEVRQQKD